MDSGEILSYYELIFIEVHGTIVQGHAGRQYLVTFNAGESL